MMQTTPESACPKCGTTIDADAPQGLCPKCVLGAVATDPAPSSQRSGRIPPPTADEVAAQFPEFESLELVGAGGMGAVYKARQSKLDRFVALKVLASDLADDPTFAERFNREARVLARLNHPHIVTVFDFGTRGPFLYLLMEYVDGVNLREAMREGRFTPTDCLSLVQDICAALQFAHDEGVLHRDIKPENVLIDSRGRLKIADFGLAKLVGNDEPANVTLTGQGSVLGTLHYMAPEQLETPQDVDQRADIYSLGVVFYELLTGELPLGRFAPPSEKSALDPRVDEVVMRALERKREQRYQNVDEVRTQVEAISQAHYASVDPMSGPPAKKPPVMNAPDSLVGFPWLAIAAAALTGVSFLLGVVAAISFPVMFSNVKESVAMAIFAVSAVVIGTPALLGSILGTMALGKMRRDGRRDGFGWAMFAALTWPVFAIMIVFGMAAPIMFLMANMSGPSDSAVQVGPIVIVCFAFAVGGLATMVLVRTVGRWALAVPRGEGTPANLKMTIGIFAVALIVLLGLPLLFNLLPAGGDDMPEGFEYDMPPSVEYESSRGVIEDHPE